MAQLVRTEMRESVAVGASPQSSPNGGDAEAAREGRSVAAPSPLSPEQLRRRCDVSALGFSTTAELTGDAPSFGQARAIEAIEVAIGMDRSGYNVFCLGPSGVGKHAVAEKLLRDRAERRGRPLDWVYVENFARPHEPRTLSMPAGFARRLANDVKKIVDELRTAIPAAFESPEYEQHLREIQQEFAGKHEALFSSIQAIATDRDVAVLPSPTGVMFAPVKNGTVLAPDEFEKLPEEEKERRRNAMQAIKAELAEHLKELPRLHREARDRIRKLEEGVTRYVVDNAVEEVSTKYAECPAVVEFLGQLSRDVIEHAADFRRDKDEDGAAVALGLRGARRFDRYSVNVLVDHSETQGAPVVYDDQASYDHLFGRIEQYAEFGNLITNFTLIKSGSLHRANGGYLLLDARKVLTNTYAWEGLKRALFSRRIQIEPLLHVLGVSSSESLRPDSIPLDVKVVLFGTREIFYLLSEHDPEFLELFKVEADFEDAVDRTPESEREFSRMIATLTGKKEVCPLSAAAVGLLIEEASRMGGDARKLSTNVRGLFDLVQEAEFRADRHAGSVISAEDVRVARTARLRQRDRFRERAVEQVARGTILIDAAGQKIGQVNGLAALSLGDFMFGHPVRITATARMGEGRVVDIEREVELGGPLHSKGVLILTNYLAQRYAKSYPLSLAASLVFEQSYMGVEGDSASLAELCALLSALAEIPLKQSIALTGSVNQWGQVQAIGAVNEKIEGFHDTCRAIGAGEHGVIIPRANVEHLMLREDAVEAAERGELRIYPVATVDEAMEVLTGLPAGAPDQEGVCPEGSINRLIEEQLVRFAVVARRFGDFFEVAAGDDGRSKKRKRRRRSA